MASGSAARAVVIVPGILGTTLFRGRRQVWGYRSIARSVGRLGQRLGADLTLPPNAFELAAHGCPDGVSTGGVLRSVGIIPGLGATAGYDKFARELRSRLEPVGSTVRVFGYDWRQSNEYSARKLGEFIERLRIELGVNRDDFRVALVGHSMGGLVARFYAECIDRDGLVERVVSIGTPYEGSIKALLAVVDGRMRLGPIGARIGELARSWPAMAELLPVGPCVDIGLPRLDTIEALDPHLPEEMIVRARSFHQTMARAVGSNGSARPTYHALLSHLQPTPIRVKMSGLGALTPEISDDPATAGDGTVARRSAVPSEWVDDAGASFVSGRHAALHMQRETIVQLYGILTSQPRIAQGEAAQFIADSPEVVDPAQPWQFTASVSDGSLDRPLVVEIVSAQDRGPAQSIPLRATTNGTYNATVEITTSGVYTWTLHNASPSGSPIEPISDVVLCASTHD